MGQYPPLHSKAWKNLTTCTLSIILGEATTGRLKHSNKCFYERTGLSTYRTLVTNERNVPVYALYALNQDTTKELVPRLQLAQAPDSDQDEWRDEADYVDMSGS